MEVRMTINAKEITREDLRRFIQLLREWELRTPKTTIVGILFDTNPQTSKEEAKDIFKGIFPEFEHLVELPGPVPPGAELRVTVAPSEDSLLNLGQRAMVIDGEVRGTVENLSLSIGRVSKDDLEALQNAHTIALVKMPKG